MELNMQGTPNLIIALVLLLIFILVIGGLGKLAEKFERNYIKESRQSHFRDKALFVVVLIALSIAMFISNHFS